MTKGSHRLLLHLNLGFCLPEEASSDTDFFVMCDMKPMIEKITNPANMLVVEFIQQTIMESLEERKRAKTLLQVPTKSRGWGKQKTKPWGELVLCLGWAE